MKRATQRLHAIHKWTGLISGINMLILSITGAYLVFVEEIHETFHAEPGEVVMTVDPESATPIQNTFDALAPRHPGAEPFRVYPTEDVPEGYYLMLRNGAGEDFDYTVSLATGEVRSFEESTADKISLFIYYLHANLFLGIAGTFFLGVVALLFLTSTVTGIFIYGPFIKQAVYGVFRPHKGVRRASADFHKLVGVSSLGFNLVIAVSAIALTIGMILVQVWSLSTVKTLTAGTPPASEVQAPPVDQVMAAARTVHPDAAISTVAYPGGYQGPNNYLIYHENEGTLRQYIPILSLVPVADTAAAQPLKMPLWIQAIMICFPLHFGNFGGLALKVVYCVFGLLAGGLTVTGALLTIVRWRRKFRARAARPAPEMRPATQPLPSRAEL